jgi:hypothetical protein
MQVQRGGFGHRVKLKALNAHEKRNIGRFERSGLSVF